MTSPVAFEISSFSLFAKAPAAESAEGAESLLILLADAEGNVAEEAYQWADKGMVQALARSAAFQRKPLAVCKTLLPFGREGQKTRFTALALVNMGDCSAFGNEDWLKLGGQCRKAAKLFANIAIAAALPHQPLDENALMHLICGFKLRNYHFDKYKKTARKAAPEEKTVLLLAEESGAALAALDKAQILADSVILARDLVNEPANILGTEEMAAHIRALEAFGIEVEILDKAALEREGFGALLAVAQGSARPPYVAVMRWRGGAEGEAPLALVGKGVVFDSGGISLKPAEKMENMKGDMGGAAAVIGAMRALAARKAKVNIIGCVGLVENMPGGRAQRPGDIVTSRSGQTIEVINTDAEGRLVLADILSFTREKFAPRLMIDFATLTGAIIVALGGHYAGLFANNAALSAKLARAGEITGERLWPMPLSPAYDRKIDSRFADMRNSCGREAGAVTAAQFLQRFAGDTPWAHIDIAGTAFGAEKTAYNHSWATGFGVRLINRLVAEFYEQDSETGRDAVGRQGE